MDNIFLVSRKVDKLPFVTEISNEEQFSNTIMYSRNVFEVHWIITVSLGCEHGPYDSHEHRLSKAQGMRVQLVRCIGKCANIRRV